MSLNGLRLGLRVIEAVLLTLLFGTLVWALSQLQTPVRGLFQAVPVAAAAIVGLIAGGTAAMRTLGVEISSASWRRALAVAAAVATIILHHTLDYAVFWHAARRQVHATDYRLTEAQVDRRVEEALRSDTGLGGFPGYVAHVMDHGRRATFVTWRGPALGFLWLAQLLVAAAVAAWWCRGASPSGGT